MTLNALDTSGDLLSLFVDETDEQKRLKGWGQPGPSQSRLVGTLYSAMMKEADRK